MYFTIDEASVSILGHLACEFNCTRFELDRWQVNSAMNSSDITPFMHVKAPSQYLDCSGNDEEDKAHM